MISKTLEDIEKDIKYLKEIANEEYFKKVEELCEKVNARSDKLQERIDKATEKIKKIQLNAYKYGAEHDVIVCEELLEILKGSDNNE